TPPRGPAEAEAPRAASVPRWARIAGAVATLAVAALHGFVAGRGSGGPAAAPPDHEGHHEPADAAPGRAWTCSMHPRVRRPAPGLCPICGMDLVPLEARTGLPPDQVALSPRARALAAVRTTPARRLAPTGATVRLLGRVDVDETTLQTVTAWVGGRIDRLHVQATGERVRRGQVLATLYSPEVFAAHQDLLVAARQLERLGEASEGARAAARASLEAAEQRLRLLGVPEPELQDMARATAPARHVAIRSPFRGTVLEREAAEGAYVETGTPLYRLADLTRLWVQLDAYESDLAHLQVGQAVELEVEALDGDAFEGHVTFVDPVVDAVRRTARVRVALANPGRRLLPGMLVEASVQRSPREGVPPLVVPASAPLFTGHRSLVYVEVQDAPRPTYEAREVRLGRRVGDVYPVVAGLAEGERVVTEGAFALDADLQLRGGRSMMARGDDRSSGRLDQARLDQALEVPDAWRSGLAPVLEAYLAMQRALAEDDLDPAREAGAALSARVAAFRAAGGPEVAVAAWEQLATHLRMHAAAAAEAPSLEALRAHFEPLSGAVLRLLRTFGNPTGEVLRVAYCPMAFDDQGASWLQEGPTVDNAYFGASMRTCGDIRAAVPPGAHLPPDDGGGEGARP
ncbi:MAG: efflux RND transporter periplasmic adaptor subunit, partial [Sandaracinaceae bacterium]